MRLLSLLVVSCLAAACHRSIDASGLYLADARSGYFLPCDEPNTMWQVGDSTLAASYRARATQSAQPLFVRLRGVKLDSSGIYGPAGSGRYHFRVQQVLEIRPAREGECPRLADTKLALPR